MNKVFNIQTQRADNGFIIIAQSDVPGVKAKRIIAHTDEEVKTAMKDCVDHMFDPPPPKVDPTKPVAAPTPVKA